MTGRTAALFTVLIWAGSFLAIHDGVAAASSLELAAARFAIVGLLAVGWLAFARGPKPGRQDIGRLAACGAIGIAGYNAVLGWGEELTGPAVAGFIVAGQVVWAKLIDRSDRNTRLTVTLSTGVALLVIGSAAMTACGADAISAKGVALCSIASFLSGIYLVIQRPLVRTYGPVTSAAATIGCGAVMLAPWTAAGLSKTVSSAEVFWPVAYLSLAAGAVAYCTWMRAIDELGPAKAARYLILLAPLAAAMEWVRNPAAVSPVILFGGSCCVLGGLVAMVPSGSTLQAAGGRATMLAPDVKRVR
ncbi:DMT family transporter [Qipengyuania qiaonensis]|uniref:DMT family transporter n=1 Tax=Qipengyuania qiaonensis TaxID=2867240 RepID=A0ABS7J5F4_9SPHN|nr:DMT family transporter [Qipengyuania qiaonensis]MBX7482133.1 DMT family transporter [Qipengyuania qiaonensis]